jgi:hypothetical protein
MRFDDGTLSESSEGFSGDRDQAMARVTGVSEALY